MLKLDEHKRLLERLDKLVDRAHVESCERIHADIWAGRSPERIPSFISFPPPPDWPAYSFTECWDDLEKNFMRAMASIYCGALLRDDRLYTMTCEYGVVNIPELFGIPSVVTDQGCAMSLGLRDEDKVRALIDRGIPDIRAGHGAKVEAFYDFAGQVLSEYASLARVVHPVIPDNQGPFDLAHLVWGPELLYALYDHPALVHSLLELVTRTYIEFTSFYKRKLGEPLNSGYHVCGVKLARGWIRICDDSAVLCSRDVYLEFAKPYNARAFAPFGGGWVHYCGNGNHILDDMLSTPGVNAVHMGNPDNCDLADVYARMRREDVVLIWSGSLAKLEELRALSGGDHPTGLMVLTENRYASADLEKAEEDLARVRSYQPIAKAPY